MESRDIPARPSQAGYEAVENGGVLDAITMRIVAVTCLAPRAADVSLVTMTSTSSRTSSLARSGNRPVRLSAERYSITTFSPSTYPSSRRPWMKASCRALEAAPSVAR